MPTEDTQLEIRRALDERLAGFEERLALAMQKALDVVVSEHNERLRAIEEDLAKVQRHLGLS